MDEITRNNSQVHAVSWRFGNWGIIKAVPLHREKFEGVNAEDWPYTTETPGGGSDNTDPGTDPGAGGGSGSGSDSGAGDGTGGEDYYE